MNIKQDVTKPNIQPYLKKKTTYYNNNNYHVSVCRKIIKNIFCITWQKLICLCIKNVDEEKSPIICFVCLSVLSSFVSSNPIVKR